MYTTNEAAQVLGVIPRRVTAMIKSGKLVAEKPGRDWIISEEELTKAMVRRGQDPTEILGKTP